MAAGEHPNARGVVLAGGRSRRMGTDKATLRFGGEALVARVVARLRAVPVEVTVMGPASLASVVGSVDVLPDAVPGGGPLAALATAFERLPGRTIVLVGCDMPFLHPPLIGKLLRRAEISGASGASGAVDVVLPRTASGLEYLHAVYLPSCAPAARRLLEQGERSLHRLLADVRVEVMEPDEVARYDPTGMSALNVNTPEQWQLALDVLRTQREVV